MNKYENDDEKILKNFGKALKHIRINLRKVSQTELSKKTGLSREFINKIEKGLVNPSLLTIERLCTGVYIPMKDLLESYQSIARKGDEIENQQDIDI